MDKKEYIRGKYFRNPRTTSSLRLHEASIDAAKDAVDELGVDPNCVDIGNRWSDLPSAWDDMRIGSNYSTPAQSKLTMAKLKKADPTFKAEWIKRWELQNYRLYGFTGQWVDYKRLRSVTIGMRIYSGDLQVDYRSPLFGKVQSEEQGVFTIYFNNSSPLPRGWVTIGGKSFTLHDISEVIS